VDRAKPVANGCTLCASSQTALSSLTAMMDLDRVVQLLDIGEIISNSVDLLSANVNPDFVKFAESFGARWLSH
jgi:hypothetical protein